MTTQDVKSFYKTYLRPEGLMEVFILLILVAAFVGAFVFLAYLYTTSI